MKNQNNALSKLTSACFKGEIDTVKQLTPELLKSGCLNIKNCVDLLKSTCMAGHLEVVEFLLNHPEPLFKQVTHRPEHINSLIETSIHKEHANVLESIKILRPEIYSNYFSSVLSVEKINDYLSTLAATGNADITKTLHKSLPSKIALEPLRFLQQAICQDCIEVFDYWVTHTEVGELEKNSYELTSLIRKGFENHSFQSLKVLGKKISLEKYISSSLLRYPICSDIDNLNFLFEHFEYLPSKELMTEFKNYVNENVRFKYTQHYGAVKNALGILESRIEISNEKNLLDSMTVKNQRNTLKSTHKI